MPQDESGRKYFMSKERIPRRMYYEVFSYWELGQEMKEQKKGEPSDLQRVDGMILQVTPEKDEWGNPTYETIFGPFMDYDQVEDILDADYGEEGSRVYPAASAAA